MSRKDWLWHIVFSLTKSYVRGIAQMLPLAAEPSGEGASGHLTSRDPIDPECFWVSTVSQGGGFRLTGYRSIHMASTFPE